MHEYLYKKKKSIRFISKLFGCIIIAVYKPKYRNQKIITKYFQNN